MSKIGSMGAFLRWKQSSASERFWKYLEQLQPLDPKKCWEWPGTRTGQGYGQLQVSNKVHLVHRLSWQIANGEIPVGQLVCHHCDNPPCCNPAHLFLGSGSDNMRDCSAKGRLVDNRGENCGTAKLTAAKVLQIRERYANGRIYQRELAAEFGVNQQQIHRIIHRERWAHI